MNVDSEDLDASVIPRRNQVLLHKSFIDTVEALRVAGIRLPTSPSSYDMDFGWVSSYPPDVSVTSVEKLDKYPLDAKSGERLSGDADTLLGAYDESVNRFSALEGAAFFTSHSLVLLASGIYEPLNLLTMRFYTGSRDISERSPAISYSSEPGIDSQKDHLKDKLDFILGNSVENSILLIDGPIIAGDVYTTLMSSIPRFGMKKVLPVFFVKNSDSRLVVRSVEELARKFNSDLHWSHRFLAPGQRTNFFKYVDRNTERNAKIFCYMKAYDTPPVRVEFFVDTYENHLGTIGPIMDMLYYLTLVQGDTHNPQVRPIAIAEMFARETLRLVDFDRMMRDTGLHPTMNQERFAW